MSRFIHSVVSLVPLPHFVFRLLYRLFPQGSTYWFFLRKITRRDAKPKYKVITYRNLTLRINLSDAHLAGLYYGYIPDEPELEIIRNLKPTDVLIDIGANAGIYSVSAPCTVWAFEPAPQAYDMALSNIRLNNRKDINLNRLALSSREGLSTLFISQQSGRSSLKGFKQSIEKMEVPTTTLDLFVEKFGIHPTFIKIDVEEHETAVLSGAEKTIKRYKPTLMVELFNNQTLRKQLEEMGYESLPIRRRGGEAINYLFKSRPEY
jgi:FkbM family methyltransferase